MDRCKKRCVQDEWINLQFNIQNDRQNLKLSFHANYKLKCRLNCLSNGFKSITNQIGQWIDVTRDAYKTKSKNRLIVEKLLSL
jgi:hypothetical protein